MASKAHSTWLLFASITAILAAFVLAFPGTLPEGGTILDDNTLAQVTGLNPDYKTTGAAFICSIPNGGSPGSP